MQRTLDAHEQESASGRGTLVSLAENSVGIGPWSMDVGPLAVILLVAVVGLVIYYVRKHD